MNKKKSIKLTLEECQEFAKIKNGKCLSKEYINNGTKMFWQCNEGHQWLAKFHDIKSGNNWCPFCVNHITKPQKKIYTYLVNQYPTLKIILNDIEVIKPKHLDIYIPTLKIGIEYDGEYWHYSEWAIRNGSFTKMNEKK